MNILYALSHINKSTQWLWFAEEMKNRGVTQSYIIIDDGILKSSCLYNDLLKLGINCHFLPYRYKVTHLYNVVKTISNIRNFRPDIIHTSLPYGNAVGQMAAMLTGVRNTVTTCENASWAHDFKNKRQELIDKFTYKFAQNVIATSDAAKEYLQENFNIAEEKLKLLYHGLKESDYETISPERIQRLKTELCVNEDDVVIGVVARYEFWKGHEFINKAAAILKQKNKHRRLKFLVFGAKGSYYDAAMKQISDLGVGDIVQYKGFVDDPVALFRLFDIHLHVPINKYVENGGINIIEGMISGIPQILTKSGYAWQSAEHMKNSYVVNYEDAEGIADAIEFLRGNKEVAQKLAQTAKADAIKTYGLKTKVDKHLALYQEMLDANLSRQPAVAQILKG